jgi:integration host factor subunit beta
MAVSKYTKADIIDLLCERSGASRKEIRITVDLFIDELKKALERNRAIELRGFGTFEIKARRGRVRARNPKTGKFVEVASHCIAVFRPGQELKKAVWNLPSALAAEGTTVTAAGPEGSGGMIAGNDEANR